MSYKGVGTNQNIFILMFYSRDKNLMAQSGLGGHGLRAVSMASTMWLSVQRLTETIVMYE